MVRWPTNSWLLLSGGRISGNSQYSAVVWSKFSANNGYKYWQPILHSVFDTVFITLNVSRNNRSHFLLPHSLLFVSSKSYWKTFFLNIFYHVCNNTSSTLSSTLIDGLVHFTNILLSVFAWPSHYFFKIYCWKFKMFQSYGSNLSWRKEMLLIPSFCALFYYENKSYFSITIQSAVLVCTLEL